MDGCMTLTVHYGYSVATERTSAVGYTRYCGIQNYSGHTLIQSHNAYGNMNGCPLQ